MKENSVKHLLSQECFWILNKALVHRFGVMKAFALTDLVDKHLLYENGKKLIEGEWFFYRREEISKLWGVHFGLQRDIIKEFKELGIIDYQKKGALKINHFKIDFHILGIIMDEAIDCYRRDHSK